MKKYTKLLLLPALSLCLCSCEVKLYTPSQSSTSAPENSTYNGTVNVVNDSNYQGTISYAPSTQAALSKEEVYQRGVKSTVYIIVTTSNSAVLGSGVVFSEDSGDGYAYIFTNAHVVTNASKIEIVYSNYKRDSATVVGYNVLEDIAVLKVAKNSNYEVATIKNSVDLETGEEVLAIGTPVSTQYSFTATSGVISKIDSPMQSGNDSNYSLLLLQIDAPLNSGNSGGPLFDMHGNLIGLNTMKLLYDDNMKAIDDFNFSIPVDRAVFIANRIFNNNPYERGLLGITITDITDMSISDRTSRNITLDYGLYVLEVGESSASNGLIQANDIVTKINDKTFMTKQQFQKELYNFSKGEQVKITVYRNGEYLDVNVTLR